MRNCYDFLATQISRYKSKEKSLLLGEVDASFQLPYKIDCSKERTEQATCYVYGIPFVTM